MMLGMAIFEVNYKSCHSESGGPNQLLTSQIKAYDLYFQIFTSFILIHEPVYTVVDLKNLIFRHF